MPRSALSFPMQTVHRVNYGEVKGVISIRPEKPTVEVTRARAHIVWLRLRKDRHSVEQLEA